MILGIIRMIEKENFDFIVTPTSDRYFLSLNYNKHCVKENQRYFLYFMELGSDEIDLNRGRFENFDKHINDNHFSFCFSILEKKCQAAMKESVEWINKHFSGKWNVKANFNSMTLIMRIDFYFNDSAIVAMFKLCNHDELYRYHH